MGEDVGGCTRVVIGSAIPAFNQTASKPRKNVSMVIITSLRAGSSEYDSDLLPTVRYWQARRIRSTFFL
jgi:hypothetical protein